jgi:predicted GIY-YIG superfamily endonuclease
MIDNFNLNNLPSVKLLDKEKLPAVSGIYFAIDNNNQLWYIGKAQNIYKRWINHHRYYQLEKINKKNPIILRWHECENDENTLIQLENHFIEYYFPALNQTQVEARKITPAEISLRKTLAKISKYVIIYGYEKNSEVFGLPTVFLKYDILYRNPAKILKQIFDGDNRKGSLKWSYYRQLKTTPIWKTKCNGIFIVVGGDYNNNFYLQTGEETTLAGVSLLNLSHENYNKAVASKDWSQSYHPNIQRYINDPFPLLWSKDLSFDLFDTEAIKEFNQKRNKSRLGQGRERGSQVKVYCEAIGRGKFVITAYQEAIEWFGGYEILGLQEADYSQARINAAPKWFKAHKVTIKIPEGDSYRSRSAPISASTNAELEQRLEIIKNISSLHQKIKFKRQ